MDISTTIHHVTRILTENPCGHGDGTHSLHLVFHTSNEGFQLIVFPKDALSQRRIATGLIQAAQQFLELLEDEPAEPAEEEA